METFVIGKLKLGEGEAIIAGDPCYFKDPSSVERGCRRVETGWEAGKYPVTVEWKDGDIIFVRVRRETNQFVQITEFIADLSNDSGQLAFAAESVLPNWTDKEDIGGYDFFNPTTDYEAACAATLGSQLLADMISTRLDPRQSLDDWKVGTVAAMHTPNGDGTWELNGEYRFDPIEDAPEGFPKARQVLIGLVFKFVQPDDDFEDEDEYWDEDDDEDDEEWMDDEF